MNTKTIKGFTFLHKLLDEGVHVFAKQKGKPTATIALADAKASSGFTLIESVVYIGILSLVSLVAVVFVSQILNITEGARRTRESVDNAHRVMEVITQEIRHAKSVYPSTSSFDISTGQLSLETTRDVPTGENTTFVDFYLDNNGVYIKREGQTQALLTSQKVKITNLTFSDLNGSNGRDAIRISVTAEYNSAVIGPKNAVSLTSTATLRSY